MTKNRQKIEFSESFCMRTPLLSMQFYNELVSGITIADQKLILYWSNPLIREIIWIASPDLNEALNEWTNGKMLDIKRSRGVKKAFIRYLIRSSTRATPFGLCAGIGMGKLAHDNNIVICPKEHKRRSRLDMHFLDRLLQEVNSKSRNDLDLKVHLNTSLYQLGEEFRFIKFISHKDGGRDYSITGIRKSDLLEGIVQFLNSPKNKSDLQKHLIRLGLNSEDADHVITQLIDNQLIVSGIQISILGNDNIDYILNTELANAQGTDIYRSISEIKQNISNLDEDLVPSKEKKDSLMAVVDEFGLEYHPKDLLQCDLFLNSSKALLKKKYGYKLGRLISKLTSFQNQTPNQLLEDFKYAFIDRYESREVPLALALDVDIGIGYIQNPRINNSTPFLDDIKKVTRTSQSHTTSKRTYIESQILIQVNKALLDNIDEVRLDLNLNTNQRAHTSKGTIAAMFEIVSGKEERIYLKSLGGSSGANLLGRFAYGSKEVYSEVQELCKYEAECFPDAIIAEIHHLPGARTGNILARPDIRDFQITYLSKQTSGASNIPINDLLVTVRNGKISLKSAKLGLEVIPRLTNAHNYRLSVLPVYRFLCDLQQQDQISGYIPRFETLFSQHFYTPRISLDNIILYKACWRLKREHFEKYQQLKEPERYVSIRKWFSEIGIPKRIQLIRGDNKLTLDLNNDHCLEILYDNIIASGRHIIQEYIPTSSLVRDAESQNYAHEFILSYKLN